jgi:hypothetical protein
LWSPFQNADAQIASRAYHPHLNEKPQDGERLPHALISRSSTVPSSDGAWDSVQNISQGMDHTANLQFADQFWSDNIYGDNTEDERPSTLWNTPFVQIERTCMGQGLTTRFWLMNARQAIQNFTCNKISIIELHSILATNTPQDHIQTVHDVLLRLDHDHDYVNNKMVLDGLLEKLQVEEVFATDGGFIKN